VLHFSYTEIMLMPDDERAWWYEKCEEYADAVNDAYKGQQSTPLG